jgi:hypothetical protein
MSRLHRSVAALYLWRFPVSAQKIRRNKSLSKQIVQSRPRLDQFSFVLGDICAGFRLEVIAKIGLVLFSNFLGGGLLAMLRIGRVVLDTHFAYVQFGIADLANVEAAQWQAKRCERRTATPTD